MLMISDDDDEGEDGNDECCEYCNGSDDEL